MLDLVGVGVVQAQNTSFTAAAVIQPTEVRIQDTASYEPCIFTGFHRAAPAVGPAA